MEIVKGQPLQLPDGTLVLPEADKVSGSKVVTKAELEAEEALNEALSDPVGNEYTHLYQRTLADVPVDAKRMNATMLIVSYTLWGLDSFAISRLMGVESYQVEAIISSDLFEQTKTQMIEAIRYAETATVHGYLAAQAHAAARTVVASLKNPSGDLKLSAAKDILDRAGFRPADRVEHTHKFEDELRIRYVSDETAVPTIEVDVS